MSDNSKKKQRLLIVDDSKVVRVTARKILRDHFETIEAVDGEKAWEILNGEAPVSVVVSDLTMPSLDGFGLLKRIRSSHLPHIRDLPVIIITGSNDTESTMERARQDGATDFIGKPFDAVHLLARTQAHANSHAVTNSLKVENATLEERTTIDPLTGLANEVAFMERGYEQLSYAIRHDNTLGLLRMEIDGYDTVFKKFGASFSESVVQTLARILDESIRQEDTIARIGTARFALLLPGMDRAGVRSLVERINASIAARTFKSGNDRTVVTVSIGIASPAIRRDMQLSELITTADTCLSRAIQRGGNLVVYDDDPAPANSVNPHAFASRPRTDRDTEEVHDKGAAAPAAAGKSQLFHDEGLEIEEIEIFNADYPFANFGPAGHGGTKIQGRMRMASLHAPKQPARNTSANADVKSRTTAANTKSAGRAQPRSSTAAKPFLAPTAIGNAVNAGTLLSGDNMDSTPVIEAVAPNPVQDGTGISVNPADPGSVQPKNWHSIGRPTLKARRPSMLRRVLIWLRLARPPKAT